jgi:hypothetical protein
MTRHPGRSRQAVLALGVCGLAFSPLPAMASDYSLPLDSVHYNQYVTAYYDAGGTKDWNCGTKTYSGHRGTDIGIGGFGPQAEGRPVLAAADGEVVATHDGEDDTCTTGSCGGTGGSYGNYVFVQHPDGKRTIYAHLKRFSVQVQTGQTVVCGQKVGDVGSSGNSTGPHLHFETRAGTTYSTATDPFEGPCSGPPNWWIEQGAHLSLPALICADFVDPWPLLTLGAEVAEIDGAPPNARDPRADVGATIVQRFEVHNTSHPLAEGIAPGLRVGFELDAPLRVDDWWVEFSCDTGWCSSPADQDPANPHPDTIDGTFALELGSLAPGTQARVSLALVGEAETGATPAHTRFFVSHVDGVYAKASWAAAFEDYSERQTWNEGDLRLDLAVSIDGIDGDDSGGSASGGSSDGDSASGGSSDDDSGSASGSGSGPGDGEANDTFDDGALPGAYGTHDGQGCTCQADLDRQGPVLPLLLLLFALGPARRRPEGRSRSAA